MPDKQASGDQNQAAGDDAFDRMAAVLQDDELDWQQAMDKLFAHLEANLQLPCEVTGIEDFQWEEPYILGGWSAEEYKRLKKQQPSYRDKYELVRISRDTFSQWMLFGDDIAAHARRIRDGKTFILGLSELKTTTRDSPCRELLDDYSTWFINSR